MSEKFLFHFPAIALSLLMMASTVPATTTVSWSYVTDQQSRSGSPSREEDVLITITDQLTEIVAPDQVLFIDYANQSLYRVTQDLQQCLHYSFSNIVEQEKRGDSELDAVVMSERYSSLAAFSVEESALWQQIEGIRCNKKTVIAGIHLLKHKAVIPQVVQWLGESFTEMAGEYWVSDQIVGWPEIQGVVSAREDVFAGYPLLKRIDPLGLITALGGFPVKGVEKSSGSVKEFVLLDKPTLKVQGPELPQGCLESSR